MAVFEPSDLFDFEPAASTPLGNGSNGSALAALNAFPPSSPPPPPEEEEPDFDELVMEAEAAEMESVARELGTETERREKDAIASPSGPKSNGSVPAAQSNGSPANGAGASNGFSLGASMFDMPEASGSGSGPGLFEADFDFGMPIIPESSNAEASSSRHARTRGRSPSLTPPPLVDLSKELYDDIGRIIPRVRAATANGEHVMFSRKHPKRAPIDLSNATSDGPLALLSTPLHKLLQEVDELRSRETAMRMEREMESELPTNGKGKHSMTMWVDKYRPKKFTDLVGDDRVHREVIKWIKEWDKCVFKRIPPKKRKAEEENQFVDPLGRPRDRVLLLSGPPGYGKTTVAHVLARQAGYRTLEINASDDRSAATVTTRIKNAIDAGSGIGAGGIPTCVVIDEIDGASGGGDTSFVRSLIKLIQDVPAKKKSNMSAQVLRRPIICICNDLYAAALRPLRPFARIVRFRKPQSDFIVQRLRHICERESLTADRRVLTSLVEITTGDLRSCLNTLQFIKYKTPVVTQDAIKTAAVGSKDSGTTLQTVWNSLFAPMAAKQKRKQLGIDDGRYVDRLAFMVQACGEYDRVMQGCFEHYPNLKPLDASLSNVCRLHDWVAYYDRLSGRVSEHMEFELMSYMPYAIVPWYSHFAAPANAARPAEWPKADYEAYQARIGNEEIATTLLASVPPTLRSLFSSQGALVELIPLLMRIISPPLKPVNANIVKEQERRVLARLVELMIPLGLRFWQDKLEDGQLMMRLEPAIDVFIHYDGRRAGDVNASRFAVRQLVAQAMDAEIARRRGLAGAETDGVVTAGSLAQQYDATRSGAASGQGKDDKVAAASRDFFGRIKEPPVIPEAEESDAPIAPPPKRFKVKYKFNEGSSAAVRKPAKMSSFL